MNKAVNVSRNERVHRLIREHVYVKAVSIILNSFQHNYLRIFSFDL